MAITITDRALEHFTDLFTLGVNNYMRLYKRTIVFTESVTVQGTDVGTTIPILNFDPLIEQSTPSSADVHRLSGDNQFTTQDFFHYVSATRTGRSVSQSGQTSESDNKQQIGSLDLYLTWSDDDHSFIGDSTVNFDENLDTLTIDITP